MVNQVIVPVDNRVITKELYSSLVGLPHIQDFEKIGRFFNKSFGHITDLIASYYLVRLSRSEAQGMAGIHSRIDNLFGNEFCQLFPFMTDAERDYMKHQFFERLRSSFDARMSPSYLEVWDSCELVNLSLDSYVVRCIRTTNYGADTPASAFGALA